MIHNRRRTAEKVQCAAETMAAVQKGKSVRETGRKFGILETTIQDRLKFG
jgi:hypothetical protein